MPLVDCHRLAAGSHRMKIVSPSRPINAPREIGRQFIDPLISWLRLMSITYFSA